MGAPWLFVIGAWMLLAIPFAPISLLIQAFQGIGDFFTNLF